MPIFAILVIGWSIGGCRDEPSMPDPAAANGVATKPKPSTRPPAPDGTDTGYSGRVDRSGLADAGRGAPSEMGPPIAKLRRPVDERRIAAAGIRRVEGKHLALYTDLDASSGVDQLVGFSGPGPGEVVATDQLRQGGRIPQREGQKLPQED